MSRFVDKNHLTKGANPATDQEIYDEYGEYFSDPPDLPGLNRPMSPYAKAAIIARRSPEAAKLYLEQHMRIPAARGNVKRPLEWDIGFQPGDPVPGDILDRAEEIRRLLGSKPRGSR